jgi:hypothetical protein
MNDRAGADDGVQPSVRHAWKWYALHVSERSRAFNAFLCCVAVIVIGYALLLDHYRFAAAGLALVASFVTFWCSRIDFRTRDVLRGVERGLGAAEKRLARLSGIPEMELIEASKRRTHVLYSHSIAIKWIHSTVAGAFLCGAAYACAFPR